jgi:CHASE1-domain containing sensor protein
MPAGSSSDRPASSPGPTTATKSASEPPRTAWRRGRESRTRKRRPTCAGDEGLGADIAPGIVSGGHDPQVANPHADHAGVRLLPLRCVLALTVVAIATAAVFVGSGRSISRQQSDARSDALAQVGATIHAQVSAAEASLEDTAAFFTSSKHVSSAEFARYARSPVSRSAVRSVGFLERVPAAERPEFERRVGQPITQFSRAGLTVASARAVYFPLRLFAGKVKQTKAAVGFDGSTEPMRRAAMNEAARTRRLVATPPLRTITGRW